MTIENYANFKKVFVQKIHAHWLTNKNITLHVLRLDVLHPVVSGNKWFKLQYYLQDATAKNYTAIATFGGAYSNHILATAYACKQQGFNCIGIIRGEEAKVLSHTLVQAKSLGMELQFVTREAYKNKEAIQHQAPNIYWIGEGGYGALGMQGATDIVKLVPDLDQYTHIICAIGTGTTLAGIVAAATHQKVIGISVMKGNSELHQHIASLLNEDDKLKNWEIDHNYHFGGYAKYNNALLQYMREVWHQYQLPTDFVYTAKAMFATEHLIKQELISRQSAILLIHTGGLQGNASLPAGTLPF